MMVKKKRKHMKLKKEHLVGKLKYYPLEVAQDVYNEMKILNPSKTIEDLQKGGVDRAFMWKKSPFPEHWKSIYQQYERNKIW